MARLFFLFAAFSILVETKAQEKQPFYFHIGNLIEALDFLGESISANEKKQINDIVQANGEITRIQKILDQHALFLVDINPESRVKVRPGSAQAELLQGGWKTFLIKIENNAGITAQLQITSEQAKRPYDGGEALHGMGSGEGSKVTAQNIADRWLDLSLYTQNPMRAKLSGMEVEYFVIQLYSRDAGKRAAKFAFDCGQATQELGFRNEVSMYFNCVSAQDVSLNIKDEHGQPSMASLLIKDRQGHVYPSQAKRLAPDFFFHPQVYRYDGESISLPPGDYTIETGRGPEYLTIKKTFTVTSGAQMKFDIKLERWIDPSTYGWYSGDHHIHAAGCSHYTSPTEGVDPADMMRHISGEGVNVGSVLTWGPGYYHQKQFFEGKDNKLSTKNNLLRYDLEISGFPSSHAGHLVLLRLKEQDYPNTSVLEDWPTYTIPILKWAKSQNAITGYAHSGLGLEVKNNALPNYDMPNFDGIGANEYIVAVTQNLVDFISTMDTPPTWELNIWYHTLNCGFRTRISGETDFPCMSDDKVAHGRSYVKCEKGLTFNDWADGLRLGKTYVSEGKSHILDFTVDGTEVGTKSSEVRLSKPSSVKVSAKVAAYLEPKVDSVVTLLDVTRNVWIQMPFWNIEQARIANTRKVAVELVVNGMAVEKKEIVADGKPNDISFETRIDRSSWVAMRIMASSHSNPIFVIVDGKPIRTNKKSAEWCLKAVDVCWEQKQNKISAKEKDAAHKDYENAKEIYRTILKESN